MTPHTIPQTVLFPDLFDKPLVATFNQEHASSDGGAVLLKAAERVYGFVKAFARCLADKRTGEDSAHARGPDRPAGLRHRVRSSRWQRCRPLGRRPHPQAAARAGPGVRRALGVATHDLAIRERRAPHRALPDGARVGGVRHRASSASPAGAGAPDHDRSGPDRRPDARGPAAHVLQRALWRLVLSADAGVSELRPRGGAVSVRGGAAAREGGGRRRDPRPAVSVAPAVAGGVSAGAVSRPARRGLCDPGDLRFPGCGAPPRLRGGDGEERGVAAACGVRHAGGPRAERGRWRDRARLSARGETPRCTESGEVPA